MLCQGVVRPDFACLEDGITAAELRGASKPNLTEALGWIGSRVDDIYGSSVGRLEDVWIDPGTGAPRWLLIKEGRFGGRTTLIPFEDATAGAGHVWVPYEREIVRQAPEVRPGAPLTQQLEARLRAHFAASGATPAVPHSQQPRQDGGGAEAREAPPAPPLAPAPPGPDHRGWEAPQQPWDGSPAVQQPPRPRRPPEMRTVPSPRPPEPLRRHPSPPPEQPQPAAAPPSHLQQPQPPQSGYAYPAARVPEPAHPPRPLEPAPPPAPTEPPGAGYPPQGAAPAAWQRGPERPLTPVQPVPPPDDRAGPREQPRAERAVALPVVGELDRPYRVEIRFRGEISISGELGGLSVTPLDDPRD